MQAFVWDSFNGGEDTTTGPATQGKEFSRVVRGLLLDENGRLKLSPGNQIIYTIPGGGNTRRIFRYNTPPLKRLMFSGFTFLGGITYALTVAAVDESNTATVNTISTVNTTNANGDDIQFVQEGNTLFFTNPAGAMKAWYGNTAALASDAGLPAPLDAPTLGLGTGTNLKTGSSGFAVPYYQWRHTYVDAQGVESNPGVASAQAVYSEEAAEVTIPAPPFGVDATKAYIYRRGGTVSGWFRVGEVTFASTNIFNDNVRDLDVGTVQLPTSNYQPPTGLDVILSHRSRLWGASSTGAGETLSPVTLWFSALNKYEQWGREDSGGINDGGLMTLRGGSDDAIKTLSSTGSILVVGRARSVWVVFGNQFREFQASMRVPVGVVSKYAMCRVYNDVYFLGTDRRLYKLTDNGVATLAEPLRKSFKEMSQAQLETAQLAFANGKLVVTFQTGVAAPNDVAYIFDVVENAWTEEQGAYCKDIKTLAHPTEARDEFVWVPATGSTIQRFMALQGTEKAYKYQTGEIFNPSAEQTGKVTSTVEHLEIEGTITEGATDATVRVICDNYTRDYTLTEENGYDATGKVIFNQRLHPDLNGTYVSASIFGTATALEVTKVRLSTSIDREAN